MPTIRADQLWTLRAHELRDFIGQMMDHLREHFPKELVQVPEWELGESIEACLRRIGERYQLTTKRECARFLALAVCHGWSFDTRLGWPEQMLLDPVGSPADRMDRVYERAISLLEQEAVEAAHKRMLGP